MSTARHVSPRSGLHADPLTGRMFAAYLVSLLLHGLLLLGITGGWLGSTPRGDKPPVYYVDLVHKPVLNPQAGRPEPRATPPAPAAPVAKAEPKTTIPVKPVPAVKTPVKATDSHVANALQKLRDEQALQQRLTALRQGQKVPATIPVGLPDAKGNEAGVSPLLFIQAFIQQNWALSPYLLADPRKMVDVSATVRLVYSKSGRLESFHFETVSGDTQFDESIKRALVKSRQLPGRLPREEDIIVTFNLKEMAEMRP